MSMPVMGAVTLAALTVVWLLLRTRVGRVALAGMIAVIAVGFVGRNVALRRLESIPVREISVGGGASEIAAARGSVRIVAFYDPSCEQCRVLVPEMARFARRRARDGVRLFAFALTDDAGEIRSLVANDPSLFDAYRVLPYRPGELSAAMLPVNVPVPSAFAVPLVAVLAADGTCVGAWAGVDNLAEVGAAVDAAIAGADRTRPRRPEPAVAAPENRMILETGPRQVVAP